MGSLEATETVRSTNMSNHILFLVVHRSSGESNLVVHAQLMLLLFVVHLTVGPVCLCSDGHNLVTLRFLVLLRRIYI